MNFKQLKLFGLVPHPRILLSKANSTTVRVDVVLTNGNFEDGNLTLVPNDVADLNFTRNDFPLEVAGLTNGQNYNLTFVVGLGSSSGSCGEGGPTYSDVINLNYQPGIFFSLCAISTILSNSKIVIYGPSMGFTGSPTRAGKQLEFGKYIFDILNHIFVDRIRDPVFNLNMFSTIFVNYPHFCTFCLTAT